MKSQNDPSELRDVIGKANAAQRASEEPDSETREEFASYDQNLNKYLIEQGHLVLNREIEDLKNYRDKQDREIRRLVKEKTEIIIASAKELTSCKDEHASQTMKLIEIHAEKLILLTHERSDLETAHAVRCEKHDELKNKNTMADTAVGIRNCPTSRPRGVRMT